MPPTDSNDPKNPMSPEPNDGEETEKTVNPNRSKAKDRAQLEAARLAEIRRKLETGEYNSQRVAEEVARRIIKRGDI